MKHLPVLSLGLALFCCTLDGRAPAKYAPRSLTPVVFDLPGKHEALELVENGRLNFAVVYDFQAEADTRIPGRQSLRLAAVQLKDTFFRTTGRIVEILDINDPRQNHFKYKIYLGRNKNSEALGMTPFAGGIDSYEVRTSAEGVHIAGYDGSLLPGAYHPMDWNLYRLNGTLWGAVDFCERVVGMRYYYPGIGVLAPEIRNLTLEPLAYHDKSEFRKRYDWMFAHEFRWLKEMPWKGVSNDIWNFISYWRMAENSRFLPSHTPDAQMVAKNFPDLLDTIFYRDPDTGHFFCNPRDKYDNLFDVSNPQFARLFVDWAKKYYATGGKWNLPWENAYMPTSEWVFFGQTDSGAVIRNKRTKKMVAASPKWSPMSDVNASFYREVATLMKKELPDKKFGFFIYLGYSAPPALIRSFPDNVAGVICNGEMAYLFNRPYRESLRKQFRGWAEVTRHPVSSWCYGIDGFGMVMNGRGVQEMIRALGKDLWRDGLMMEAHGVQYSFYYSYYSFFKVLWNPEFDIDAALEEHWKPMYGKAASDLKRFHDRIVDLWINHFSPKMRFGDQHHNMNLLYQQVFSPPVIAELEQLLKDAAKQVAPESIESMRVAHFAKPWPAIFKKARDFAMSDTRELTVKYLSDGEQILIDGKPDESVWRNNPGIRMIPATGGNNAPGNPLVRMAWNKKGIYLIYSCEGKPEIMKGNLWGGDYMEFFLSEGLSKSEYIQIAVSSAGDLFQARKRLKPVPTGLQTNYRCQGMQYAVHTAPGSWSAEIFVPFSGLGVSAPHVYSSWCGNVIGGKKSPPSRSAMTVAPGSNHDVNFFGYYKFMGRND